MKKKIVSIVLFIFVFININSQVNNTFRAIKENTEKTAQHTEKGSYEYISISLSILAFITAGLTLYFSVKTYSSQKKTEKNTRRWPAKQERANLRRIAWKLLMSYRKLLTLETIVLFKHKFPLPENFTDMKINIEDLHLNEYFGDNIDYNALFLLGDKINEFNSMMDNRSNQSKAFRIPRDIRRYAHELPHYFHNERKTIMETLCTIDKLYPHMFDESEKLWKDINETKELTELKPLFISDYYSSSYNGCFEVIIESAKGVQNSSIGDIYFSLPFIWIFNLMRNQFQFYNFHNPEKADKIRNIIKEINFYDVANIYFDSIIIPEEQIDIESILTNEKGLFDYNEFLKAPRKQVRHLPLYENYIKIVLFLIEVDSRNYNTDAIEDIYLIDRVNEEEL